MAMLIAPINDKILMPNACEQTSNRDSMKKKMRYNEKTPSKYHRKYMNLKENRKDVTQK